MKCSVHTNLGHVFPIILFTELRHFYSILRTILASFALYICQIVPSTYFFVSFSGEITAAVAS